MATGTIVAGALLAHHPPDEEHLLGVLQAEDGMARPRDVEEAMDHLQHTAEVSGPGRAFERVADGSRIRLLEQDTVRVDLFDRRRPDRVDAQTCADLQVPGLVAGIGGEILARTELGGVHEDRHEHATSLLLGSPDQRRVTGVQRTHRRDQPHVTVAAPAGSQAMHVFRGSDQVHPASTSSTAPRDAEALRPERSASCRVDLVRAT